MKDVKTSDEWKNKNLKIIVSRMKGWQKDTFKEFHENEIKEGILLKNQLENNNQ